MSERINRQWLLSARPCGMVKESDFEYREGPLAPTPDGGLLVRNLYLSFDPAMRSWIVDFPSYLPPVEIGAVMRGGAVGQVVESRRSDFEVGDVVQGMMGWQEYAVLGEGPALVNRVPKGVPIELVMGVLGLTGLTAYFGLLDIGQPVKGETVVVSGAAGATGSVAAQIAKIKGCRVIGIAGGAEKCAWLSGEVGLDAAIDYKSEDVDERLRVLCPGGIDIYFDNVGGTTLDSVLAQVARKARIVLCGAISRYNDEKVQPGPSNYTRLIVQRGRMEGFIVLDYMARATEATKELAAWVAEGRIAHREDVQEGFENAPRTLRRLFQGKNFGRQLLKVGDLLES